MNSFVLGIDVGGTKVAGGLVRLPGGELLFREVIPALSAPTALDLAGFIRRLEGQAKSRGIEVAGVGIGVPDLVDEEGRVGSGRWRGVKLAESLGLPIPVCVEADVRAAAWAEALLGAGRPFRLFLYVSVGTGISSTFVQDGTPYRGARGNALVLASAPMTTLCSACGALSSSVLEEVASGPALAGRYNQLRGGAALRSEEVMQAALASDADATRVIREAALTLGSAVALLVNVLDPHAVIFGGGLALAGGPYWEVLVDSLRQHIWAPDSRSLPLLQAHLGADAGWVGAAVVCWRHLHASASAGSHRDPSPTQEAPE